MTEFKNMVEKCKSCAWCKIEFPFRDEHKKLIKDKYNYCLKRKCYQLFENGIVLWFKQRERVKLSKGQQQLPYDDNKERVIKGRFWDYILFKLKECDKYIDRDQYLLRFIKCLLGDSNS